MERLPRVSRTYSFGIIRGMISMPENLPDDPVLLKQLLEQMLSERESDKGKIVHLEEENALLRQRLFGRKSEQTADPTTPQMALFNEAEAWPGLSTKQLKKRS